MRVRVNNHNSRKNEGKEGYCDYMNPTRESQPGEESVVRVDKNWGHCADWCHETASQAPSRKLMETGLNLLSVDVCDDLGGKLHFNRTIEFCTGNKKPFPKIDVFHATGKLQNYLSPPRFEEWSFVFSIFLSKNSACQKKLLCLMGFCLSPKVRLLRLIFEAVQKPLRQKCFE